MLGNSTSFSIQPQRSSPPTGSTVDLSVTPPCLAASRAPVMRSKSSSQVTPDFGAMRARRAASEMRLSELKCIRRPESTNTAGRDVPEAHEYPSWGGIVADFPSMAMDALKSIAYALADPLSSMIGSLSADVVAPDNSQLSVEAFMKKHAADNEIRLSPAARQATDLRGMIIVIGEHHNDPAIQNIVKDVMQGFSRDRGDRFFLEGDQAEICWQRQEKYQMDLRDCWLLEEHSPHYMQAKRTMDECYRRLKDCVRYLKLHVAAAHDATPSGQDNQALADFIGQYVTKLPLEKYARYNELATQANDAQRRLKSVLDRTSAGREVHMADYIRRHRSRTALNYVIVGGSHLNVICGRLRDLPTMLILPKAMHDDVAMVKDEM